MTNSMEVSKETVEAVETAIGNSMIYDFRGENGCRLVSHVGADSVQTVTKAAIAALLASGEIVTSAEVEELVSAAKRMSNAAHSDREVSADCYHCAERLDKALARFQPKQSSKRSKDA